MSRFSPTVAPTWGQSFGHALEGGVDAFLQARRQKLGQEDEMFARGYRPATDADLQPAPVQPTAEAPAPWQPGTPAETNASIVRGVQAAQTPTPALAGPDGAQALSGGPPPNFKGRPKGGQLAVDPAMLAQALASHVQSGQPLRAPDAAPPTPQAVGQALQPRHALEMGGRQWMRTDESQAQMDRAAEDRALKEALSRSEIFKNTAQGTKDLREPRDAPLVQQGHVVDPVTGEVKFFDPTKPPTDLRVHPIPKPVATEGLKFKSDQLNKIVDDYRADTADFKKVMSGWDVLNGATKDPNLTTPFAITDAYARITNPGALVRPTTMEMIHQMGSLGQRMQKAWESSTTGQLPPDIVRDFQTTLYNIVREHKNQFDQTRQKAILRGRNAGVDVEPVLEDYPLADPTAPPAGSTGNVDLRKAAKPDPILDKFGLTPKGH